MNLTALLLAAVLCACTCALSVTHHAEDRA
ncbi:hypothetical protein SAMN05216214_11281 [Atopomonas hussainii]|uniref:Uncharacterized protein n=1 Tax=Atopomonas hussainii TaxID=1429083 RepID=A0A1H7QA60_9GAMM|nr:hypothetical protein SAMN05216214_11281 [Atopomonas hussainii]